MRKPILFGLLGVVIFIGFIVARAPAGPVWRLLAPQVTSALPGINVNRVEGTVWRGQARVQYANMLPSQVNWDLTLSGLVSGQLPFAATIDGDSHHIDITGSLSPTQLHIESLTGTLAGRYLSQYAQRYQIQLAGELNIISLRLATDQRWPTEALGNLNWNGGAVSIPGSQGRQNLQLPALHGQLTMLDNQLQLQIRDSIAGTGNELLTVSLLPTGWATVAIKTRMFKLAGIILPGNQGPDDMALTLEEKLF